MDNSLLSGESDEENVRKLRKCMSGLNAARKRWNNSDDRSSRPIHQFWQIWSEEEKRIFL